MKNKMILFFIVTSWQLQAQKLKVDFPFSLSITSECLTAGDSILPVARGDVFVYVNTKTDKDAFPGEFKEAYPFRGMAAIARKEGGYGIIGRDGKWIKNPVYSSCRLADGHVAVMNPYSSQEYTFDLSGLRENCGYINCAMPTIPSYRAVKVTKGKWDIVSDGEKFSTPYDSIVDVYDKNKVIAVKKGKFGIGDFEGNTIVPFVYSAISWQSPGSYYRNLIGLLKGNIYYYYDLSQKQLPLILKSSHRCPLTGNIWLKNAVGMYQSDDGYNILFNDGSTFTRNYDYITENGRVAVRGNNVYILNDDKTEYLYYSKI